MARKWPDLTNKLFERNFIEFQRAGLPVYRAFEDFLEVTTLAICNALSLKDERREEREAKYLGIVGRYKKELIDVFPKMLADFIHLLEKEWWDPLGEFFENHITFWENGQFFTPMHLSQLAAELTLWKEIQPKSTVMDCACWSGRMLISALDKHRDIVVYGADLDRRCVLMATLNLFYRWATWYIYWMNSLSLEVYGGYKFGMFGGVAPYLYELKKEEIRITEPMKQQIQETAIAQVESGKQMSLFTDLGDV